jgi:biopolymer transport protein ExbD
MAFSLQNANGDVLSEMNTTPLIDVMLVLLTLLIITLPMQTHAVKLTLPSGPPQPPMPVVMLEVDFDNSIVWNGWRIDRATLERKLALAAAQNPQPEIHMMAHRMARYENVAQVLSDVQRFGLTKMGLIDTQKY